MRKQIKGISFLLALLLTATAMLSACTKEEEPPVSPDGEDPQTEIETETETEAASTESLELLDWVTIDRVEQLGEIALNGRYILGADLNLGGVEWTPVGTVDKPFLGVFDGNGHTLSNFQITTPGEYNGLFGFNAGTIQNLHLSDYSMVTNPAGTTYAGSIAGWNESTILNCSAKGILSVTSQFDVFLGGLVGSNRGDISDCTAEVAVTFSYIPGSESRNGTVGGLIGRNQEGTVRNCHATGTVTTNGNGLTVGRLQAGALVAYNYYGTLEHCTVSGDVSVTSDFPTIYAGGVVGRNFRGVIRTTSCTGGVEVINNPKITLIEGTIYAGGFVGHDSDGILSDVYSASPVTVTSYCESVCTGGMIGYHGSGELKHFYVTGDITTNMMLENATVRTAGVAGSSSTADYQYGFATGAVNFISPFYYHDEKVGRLVAAGSGNLVFTYYVNGQKIHISRRGEESNVADNVAGRGADRSTLLTVAFQTETLLFGETAWNLVDGQLPTLK